MIDRSAARTTARRTANSPGADPAPGWQPGPVRRDAGRPGSSGLRCRGRRGARGLGGAAGGRRSSPFPGHGGELHTRCRRAHLPWPRQHPARVVRRPATI